MKFIRLRNRKLSIAAMLISAMCLALGAATTSLAAGMPGQPGPTRAASAPDGMTWRDYHLMMAQMPLDAAATKIQALAAKPGPAHRGFFETKVIPLRHTLVVYWHGSVPANVAHLIARLRTTIRIEVVKTRYSLAALNRDVLAAIHSDRAVTGGWPLTGGSGIQIGVRSGNPRSLASAMRSRLGVPVTVARTGVDHLLYSCSVPGSDANLGPGSRCNDWENFWGGDVIQQTAYPGGAWCSGGFGVHNSSGGEYLLTAAHCADNGSGYANGIKFWNGQTLGSTDSKYVGQITDVPGNHDAAVIPTGTGSQYYDGPGIYNGDTTHTKYVAGQQATSVGDSLCESGAFGGVKCGFTVAELNATIADPDYGSPDWTALALASPGSAGNPIPGDSGGPWFSLDGCCTHVWAKGLTHGLYYGYAVFTPVTVATNDMGVWVNTG